MKFEIIEVDRDYRTITNTLFKYFDTEKDADKWCEEKSWTGYDYSVIRKIS